MSLSPRADAIVPAGVLTASKWPFPRSEMTEPGLIVCRLAEDIADLFDAETDELSIDALVSLGWPREIAAQYFDVANQHAAPIIATGLRRRWRAASAVRDAAPIPVEPSEQLAPARLSGPPANPCRAFNAMDAQVGLGGLRELRAFAVGMAGGGLAGATLAFSVLRLLEALR